MRLIKGLVGVALLTTITACSNNQDKGNVIDTSSIATNSSLTGPEKAERLAKASEQLISFQGFAYASDVADLALAIDPSNLRAQFIKVVIGPILTQKGIYARVKPLSQVTPEATAEYAKGIASIQQSYSSTLNSFILDGQADIKTEGDIQDYLDSVANSFKAIREFAKANKNSELTVMLGDTFYQSMIQRYTESCKVDVEYVRGYPKYISNCPDMKSFMEVKLNRADFEAIQAEAAGLELYFSLLNSYNLTGSIETAVAYQGETPSSSAVLSELLKNKEFATIRAGNGFKKVKEMGLDAIAAVTWIMNNQNSLCPMGVSHPRNRLDMLVSNGFCVDKKSKVESAKDLAIAKDALSGRVFDNVDMHLRNGIHRTSIKADALLENPIVDLRSILPTNYDGCHNPVAIQDATLNGTFPKADLNYILASNAQCH
ncbi:MAG: hypothetical protein H7061_04820 [Bdellovibrionaceae bacterium]|nr:hypothetical protein [Bdellovibrio sp.]